MVKVLDFMGLTYKDLYKKTSISENMRKTLYKEDTNVLSYYIITLILLNNYQGFLGWCKKNNFSLLDFKKTIGNQEHFCNFIKKNYNLKLFNPKKHNLFSPLGNYIIYRNKLIFKENYT